jgi:hypothetical protein
MSRIHSPATDAAAPGRPASRQRGLTGRRALERVGWSYELTEEFVVVWLDDWYLRGGEPGLAAQMDEHALASWGVDAATFTTALLSDLDLR